jgi:N-acetylmuramoyl-L-alanine amidase
MYIRNHRLHDDERPVRFIASPHQSERLEPWFLIVHYTASLTLRSTVGWFLDPHAKVSAHVIVDRDGDAVQMVSLDRQAWHAGVSRWHDVENLNAYSIGLDMVNAGALDRADAGEWVDWAGHVALRDDVLVARHEHEAEERGWHRYPEPQIARAIQIGKVLHREYGFRAVLGHDDVAPGRKIDPGPAFPLQRFMSEVLGLKGST